MKFVRTLCAAFMVTVVVSKPVPLGQDEGSLESAESNESNEESAPHGGLTQEPRQEPAFKETPVLAAMEEADPPAASAPGPSAALPDPDPQASTDASPLTPDGPSPTALGGDVSHTQVLLLPGLTETDVIIEGTDQPQVTTLTAHTPPHQGATAPIGTSTPPPSTTATPLPIPISTALTGLPVCFSFQFTTPEPEPPRGDNM